MQFKDSSKVQDFFRFVYELRKFDVNNELTAQILNKRLNPPILLDIIKSNQFIDGHMQPTAAYRICSKGGSQLFTQLQDDSLLVKQKGDQR